MVGTTISHYKVLEKIGQGGMGEVYLAQDTSLDRKVALKFLPDFMKEDPTARKRFLREAKSAAALDHPYICHIHEVGEEEGKSFISMEYVQGKTLKEKLAEGPLPLKDVLQKATEIAEALEEAHKQSIVHRDLKLSNIMLTPQGHVKVMDFGLAKRLVPAEGVGSQEETLTASLTKTGSTLGTLAYMSPEQLRGEEVDTRSDIFSFGVVLYKMLTGVDPFRKKSHNETASAILNDTPAPLFRYVEDIPELLQHMVKKMLSKEPDERYQSVHEVRTNFGSLLAGDPAAVTAAATQQAKRSRLVGALAVSLATVAIIVLAVVRLGLLEPQLPLVIMMDSPHPARVYDEETRATNGTNADVLSDILSDLPVRRQKEAIGPDWHRDEEILRFGSDVIIIHYSGFRQEDGSGPRTRLKLLIQFLTRSNTKFLIYGRTSESRLRADIDDLLQDLYEEYPDLWERTHVFGVTDYGPPKWLDPGTSGNLKLRVKEILDLEDS